MVFEPKRFCSIFSILKRKFIDSETHKKQYLNIYIKYWIVMTSRTIVCLLFIILAIGKKEIWIKYEALKQESDVFQKYFHRNKYGYFVDLGGFDSIHQSNTVKLSNWNGLIVEANEKRASKLRDFQPHITLLNFAVSNVSGQMATFYEAEYTQASSLSQKAVVNDKYKQQKVMVINMADLCHKYYKSKPHLLNIDVEGIGQIVLQANDWKTDKCIPDIIYAEDDLPNRKAGYMNLQQIVLSHNYTKMDRVVTSSLFIHNSKLQFYKKQAQANAEYISNKILYKWVEFAESLSNLLGNKFDADYDPKTHPAYPFFRQQNIIDITEINKYSNFVSTVGPNRPIIIMEYDEKISTIYLGTAKYIVQTVLIDKKFTFKKITAQYDSGLLIIYVFNHQKYNQFNIKVLETKQNSFSVYLKQEKNEGNYYEVFSIVVSCLIIVFMLVVLWKIQQLISSNETNSKISNFKQLSNSQL